MYAKQSTIRINKEARHWNFWDLNLEFPILLSSVKMFSRKINLGESEGESQGYALLNGSRKFVTIIFYNNNNSKIILLHKIYRSFNLVVECKYPRVYPSHSNCFDLGNFAWNFDFELKSRPSRGLIYFQNVHHIRIHSRKSDVRKSPSASLGLWFCGRLWICSFMCPPECRETRDTHEAEREERGVKMKLIMKVKNFACDGRSARAFTCVKRVGIAHRARARV